MKIGVYGGTFNPIHLGHVALAKSCADALGLDQVIFIPTYSPPHKAGEGIAQAYHRMNLCRLAVEDEPRFMVSDIEVNRKGVSYTVDTLRALKGQYPDAVLYLIMGSDMYFTIEQWRSYEEILRIAIVVTASREAGELAKLQTKQELLHTQGFDSIVLDNEVVEVSSTQLREDMNPELLDPKVLAYIRQNSLYGYQDQPYLYDTQLIAKIVGGLLGDERYHHSQMVAKAAAGLAEHYGLDAHHAYVAGLIHDVCKEMTNDQMQSLLQGGEWLNEPAFYRQPHIWHGFAAAIFIQRELKIYNHQIIEAVRFHTTGRAEMSEFEKIIFLADLISDDRVYADVGHLRQICYRNLDEGLAFVLQYILSTLTAKAAPLYSETVKAYNQYMEFYKA